MDKSSNGVAGKSRSQMLIEKGAQDMMDKFNQIDQVFHKLQNEEISTREKLRKVCQELRAEVEQGEAKHKKIQEFLKTFKEN